jgi:4-hydroxy-tetrahydrodipicolinate synthase
MELQGCGTALVTPFRSDGAVDEPALCALVDWQIQQGVDFLVPCGTTGEASTLTESEHLRTVETVLEAAAGRVPVVAGCTGNATFEVASRARRLAALADLSGILSANPFYNRPGQEGQYRHFMAIADAIHLPLILYNIPARTGVNLEPATVVRLAEHPNIRGIKESSGNLAQVTELLATLPRGFRLFAGDDALVLPILALGGAGLISVASNAVPGEMAALVHQALRGDLPSARKLNHRLFHLLQALFVESNPAPIKCLLHLLGRGEDHLRLPLLPVTPQLRRRLERLAGELGLFINLPPTTEDLRMF